jgi:lysophospholipase L1-like esterase
MVLTDVFRGWKSMGDSVRVARLALLGRPLFTLLALVGLFATDAVAQDQSPRDWKYDPQWLVPFWESDIMHGESTLFVRDPKTGQARASLLFPIEDVLIATDSTGENRFEKGRDYLFTTGSRELVLPTGSRIASMLAEELRRPARTQKYALTHRDGQGEIFFGEKLEYAEMQTCFTYRHPGAGDSWPKADRVCLPRCASKLAAQSPLMIVTLGDSIAAGANASGMYGAKPYQPAFPELVRCHLSERHGGPVAMTNLSVGGMDTAWGITQVDKVVAARPDLVILAFGMNDSAGRTAPEYQANTRKTIDAIRQELPECEFVLVASMLGNRDWVRLKHELFPQYRVALQALCQRGIALADVTMVWSKILEHKKDWDQTGNGVNHPNDFGHRVYAQQIAALLLP